MLIRQALRNVVVVTRHQSQSAELAPGAAGAGA